jgi:DNA-directed RNA polymerase specialized sigma24 family protein
MLPAVGILEPGPGLFSLVTRRSILPPPPTAQDGQWEASWDYLGEVYAPAMRRYVFHLLKRWHQRVPDPDEPEAIVQGFMMKCMESGQLSERKGEVRKFRGWVAVHLKGYVKDYLDKKYAKKRNPEGALVSDEALFGVAGDAPDPQLEAQLDKGWVQVALERAQEHLRAGVGARKWGPVYADIIQDLLLTGGEGSPDLHERLGVEKSKLPNLKNRAKAKLAELFVDELRTTVADEQSLEELLRDLTPYLP